MARKTKAPPEQPAEERKPGEKRYTAVAWYKIGKRYVKRSCVVPAPDVQEALRAGVQALGLAYGQIAGIEVQEIL